MTQALTTIFLGWFTTVTRTKFLAVKIFLGTQALTLSSLLSFGIGDYAKVKPKAQLTVLGDVRFIFKSLKVLVINYVSLKNGFAWLPNAMILIFTSVLHTF